MAQHFPLGRLFVTRGISDLIDQGINIYTFLKRHVNADWGDICEADKTLNDLAINSNDRLFSSYQVHPELKIWIITEADRSATTMLLPSEY